MGRSMFWDGSFPQECLANKGGTATYLQYRLTNLMTCLVRDFACCPHWAVGGVNMSFEDIASTNEVLMDRLNVNIFCSEHRLPLSTNLNLQSRVSTAISYYVECSNRHTYNYVPCDLGKLGSRWKSVSIALFFLNLGSHLQQLLTNCPGSLPPSHILSVGCSTQSMSNHPVSW